jgi:hypothetical protein
MTLRSRGTSRAYIVERLIRDQRLDLLEAIEARQISAFAAAVECGYARRRARRTGGVDEDDCNVTKTRKHAMATALAEYPPAMAYVSGELPCFACRQPEAWRALKEIADTYLRAKRGESSRASMSGALPMACCRRRAKADVAALIA